MITFGKIWVESFVHQFATSALTWQLILPLKDQVQRIEKWVQTATAWGSLVESSENLMGPKKCFHLIVRNDGTGPSSKSSPFLFHISWCRNCLNFITVPILIMNEKTIPILKRGPGFEEPSGYSSLKIVKSLPPPLIPQLRKRPRINLLLR